MFEALRKYQGFLSFIIAGVVFSSLIFFGTFSAQVAFETKEENKVLGKLVNGKDLNSKELDALTHFLSGDWQEEHPQFRNMLNDGVLRRDLLLSGVMQKVFERYADEVKEDFEERLQKIKNFKGYQHPNASFLSARAIWERISPELNRSWSFLVSEGKPDSPSFEHLVEIYEYQRSIPASWLRSFLTAQERQYSWIEKDPMLATLDLSLFGFKSASDWFGKKLISKAAIFILNGASLAEEHGIYVSQDEARNDLRRLFSEASDSYKKAKIPIQISYLEQLKILGLEEYEATSLWRKVLLFRRWMQKVGSSVLVDRLSAKESSLIAGQEAVVDVYQFNKELSCKSAKEAFGLYLYWKALFLQNAADLNAFVPDKAPSVSDVAKRAPELVFTPFTAKVSAVDKREVGLLAPMKEVIDYELSDKGWALLKKKFSFLKSMGGKDQQERFAAIEKLDPSQRTKVDLFTRRQLVDLHPEWIDLSLKNAPSKVEKITLSAGEIHLNHIDNPKELGNLFASILQKPEESLEKLQKFESNEAVFRFESIEKQSDETIKTYAQAKEDGSIDRIVSKAIGSLDEKEIEKQAASSLQDWAKSSFKKEIWGAKKLYPLADLAKRCLAINPMDSKFVSSSSDDPLIAQFKLQKVEETVRRTINADSLLQDTPFTLNENDWSDVLVSSEGAVGFIYLKKKNFQEPSLQEQILGAQEMLGIDAKQTLAEYILAKMVERNAAF